MRKKAYTEIGNAAFQASDIDNIFLVCALISLDYTSESYKLSLHFIPELK